MRDSVRLCGRLWLPAGADAAPCPVVLEYIPYRTRDLYRAADDHWGEVLASYGIGFARIDIRGSGESEGILRDEYLAAEQDDAVEIIAWLARQPWCSGAVGMRGISWGGFSTLQTAMRRPPALKAIMPMACSDRRYTDDAHYVGGCLGLTNFKWGVDFTAVMASPPDPAVAGEDWEAIWRARLAAVPPIMARWMQHPLEDAYWRHGSLTFDYAAIACPTYIVGGWADAYVNSVPRLLAGLRCPKKALVGPWGHTYPWLGGPGPALDWAYEEVRWWSQWLTGASTGIMAEPMFRYFNPTSTPAQSAPGATPGNWTAEAGWPTRSVVTRTLFLTDHGLSDRAGPAAPRTHRSDNRVGLQSPEWVPFGQQEMPRDQRADDLLSIVYDLPALSAPVDLLGTPRIRLRLSADRPAAQVAVRLCKVMPDGTSWRLAYGLLDLTHRNGHSTVIPLTPSVPVDVDLELGFIAHRLLPGERLRLAISEGLWPLVWPSPEKTTLTLHAADSTLMLPVRAPPAIDPTMPIAVVPIAPDAGAVVVAITAANGKLAVTGRWPDQPRTCANGTILSGHGPDTVATIDAGDPNGGMWSGERVSRFRRGNWDCQIRVTFTLRSTPTQFFLVETLVAESSGVKIFERTVPTAVDRNVA